MFNLKSALNSTKTVIDMQIIKSFLPIIGNRIVAGFFFVSQCVLGVLGREAE